MKYLIIAGVVIGVLAAGFMFMPSKTVYMNPEVVEKKVVTEVNHLDEQYKQRNDELEEKYRKIQDLEARLDVNKAEIKRLEAQDLELQKELAGFILQKP
jgi:septal ring factor EnvC (AmiA/AmiB activator)